MCALFGANAAAPRRRMSLTSASATAVPGHPSASASASGAARDVNLRNLRRVLVQGVEPGAGVLVQHAQKRRLQRARQQGHPRRAIIVRPSEPSPGSRWWRRARRGRARARGRRAPWRRRNAPRARPPPTRRGARGRTPSTARRPSRTESRAAPAPGRPPSARSRTRWRGPGGRVRHRRLDGFVVERPRGRRLEQKRREEQALRATRRVVVVLETQVLRRAEHGARGVRGESLTSLAALTTRVPTRPSPRARTSSAPATSRWTSSAEEGFARSCWSTSVAAPPRAVASARSTRARRARSCLATNRAPASACALTRSRRSTAERGAPPRAPRAILPPRPSSPPGSARPRSRR